MMESTIFFQQRTVCDSITKNMKLISVKCGPFEGSWYTFSTTQILYLYSTYRVVLGIFVILEGTMLFRCENMYQNIQFITSKLNDINKI